MCATSAKQTSELADVEAHALAARRSLVAREDRVRVEDELRRVVQTAQLVEQQSARAALVERRRRLAEERVHLQHATCSPESSCCEQLIAHVH